LLLPVLLVLGCDGYRVADIGVPAAGGGLPVTLHLRPGVDPGGAQIALDGQDVRALFSGGPPTLTAVLPLPTPGAHTLRVTQPALGVSFGATKSFDVPAPTPALASVTPATGPIPVTSWLRFEFQQDVSGAMLTGFGFALEGGGQPIQRFAYTVESRSVVIDPSPGLPSGSCRVVWRDASGVTERVFTIAAPAATGVAAVI